MMPPREVSGGAVCEMNLLQASLPLRTGGRDRERMVDSWPGQPVCLTAKLIYQDINMVHMI